MKSMIGFLATLLLAAICSSPGLAAVTAKPEISINPFVHGSDAQLINGSILGTAISVAGPAIQDRKTYSNSDLVLMHNRGVAFDVVRGAFPLVGYSPGRSAENLPTHQVKTSDVAAAMSLGKLRAVAAANHELARMQDPLVTDHKIANYDILIFPIASGSNAGKLFVEYAHHVPAGASQTRAGCVDSFGGYNGSYIVDQATEIVVSTRCS